MKSYNGLKEMRFGRKLLIVLGAIAALGGVFYLVFNRPGESAAGENPLSKLVFGGREDTTAGEVLSSSKEFVGDKLSSVTGSVKGSFKEKESELLDSLKESANEFIDTAQRNVIGSVGGGEEESGSVKVFHTVKIGADAYFLMSSSDSSREIRYEVDWGDDSTEKGTLAGGEKTISHSWDKAGEFSVIFKISGADSGSESIKVTVVE